MECWVGSQIYFQFKLFTEILPGMLSSYGGLGGAVAVCSNEDLVANRHIALKKVRQVQY